MKFLYLSLIILICTIGKAQQNTILKIKFDLIIMNQDFGNENELLYDFEQKKSIFICNKSFRTDTIIEKSNSVKYKTTLTDSIGNVYLRDFGKKELKFRITIFKEDIILDKWKIIQWEITNEQKKIGNLNCTKAIGEFRGRTYVCWFSYDIPAPIGPWKLFGLPGAIIEAYDKEQKAFYAMANEISVTGKEEVNFEKKVNILKKDTYLNMTQYEKKIEEMNNNLMDEFKKSLSRLPRGLRISNMKFNSKRLEKFDFEN